MVKGTSRQVIVVRPPNTELFEQAIFILKDRAEGGVSDEQLLRQAREAADTYLRGHSAGGRVRGVRLRPVFSALLGALSVSVLWVLWALLL